MNFRIEKIEVNIRVNVNVIIIKIVEIFFAKFDEVINV